MTCYCTANFSKIRLSCVPFSISALEMIKSITFHTRPLRSKVIFEIFPIISTYLLQSQQPFMDSSKKLFKDLLRKHLQLQSSYGNNNICPKIPFSFTKVRGKIIFCCKKKKNAKIIMKIKIKRRMSHCWFSVNVEVQ